ncbi:periplasmic heavy metal sensor [Puniceibacterium sp. IMCC21224]|uniref:periplasmic heavy metal sensor n=1 Tax=Puniceibacterium sp. IMCC21224 TaxID=1618204 RepID=UPI00064D9724|nr:periplasmic heavy metal sensor [Puniceibacterium sp. IMCC21224]KMK68101.1 putative integral membrane protein [Puniceibacterium sp. IMCC21224]
MTERTDGRRRWVRIALVVSLALNLAVVAALAGLALRGGPKMGNAASEREGGAPYARALEPEDRRVFGRMMRDAFRKSGPERGAIAADYRSAVAALRAEPFDPVALEVVLIRQNTRAVERQQLGQGVLLAYITALTPEQRAAYADRLDVGIDRVEDRWGHAKRD